MRTFGQMQHALRDTQPSQAACIARGNVQRQQNGFAFVGQQFGVCERARCNDPNHFAFNGAFAGGHIAHLFADGH